MKTTLPTDELSILIGSTQEAKVELAARARATHQNRSNRYYHLVTQLGMLWGLLAMASCSSFDLGPFSLPFSLLLVLFLVLHFISLDAVVGAVMAAVVMVLGVTSAYATQQYGFLLAFVVWLGSGFTELGGHYIFHDHVNPPQQSLGYIVHLLFRGAFYFMLIIFYENGYDPVNAARVDGRQKELLACFSAAKQKKTTCNVKYRKEYK